MARLIFHRAPFRLGDPPLFLFRLKPTRTRIGRMDDCDVVLPDDAVSRSHCVIDRVDDHFELLDRSSNGTFRNGERVTRARLGDGDEIRVGGFVAVVDLREEPAANPTERAEPERADEEVLEAGEGVQVAEAWLTITRGPGEGKKLRLRGARLGVGGPASRVALPDPRLVDNHVFIRLVNGRTMVEPGEGAAWVGGQRVRDVMPIYAGEEVLIGGTELVVSWEARQDSSTADRFGEMVAASTTMQRIFGTLRRVAAHHAPVLLIGESGTGKELAARAIHEASPRAKGPFVAVNCGAITSTLFESELFGHEKGSFTGASERRDGAFQRADRGTLFLDEVGELPEEAQSKLLRALESGEVRRVGGAQASFPDVRVVAATNRNLVEAAQAGSFRSDLYFRLAVLALCLPPLRERPEDLPLLAETIARRLDPRAEVTPEAVEVLRRHPWPGNARELRNVLTRAVVLGGPRITPESLVFNPIEGALGHAPQRPPPGRSVIEDTERDVVMEALRQCGQNRAQAARALGIPRSTLIYKLRRWGIDPL